MTSTVPRTERPDDAVVTLEQIVGLTALEDIDAGEVLTTSMFG